MTLEEIFGIRQRLALLASQVRRACLARVGDTALYRYFAVQGRAPLRNLEQQIKQLEENLDYSKPEVPSEPAVLPPGSNDSGSKTKPN